MVSEGEAGEVLLTNVTAACERRKDAIRGIGFADEGIRARRQRFVSRFEVPAHGDDGEVRAF